MGIRGFNNLDYFNFILSLRFLGHKKFYFLISSLLKLVLLRILRQYFFPLLFHLWPLPTEITFVIVFFCVAAFICNIHSHWEVAFLCSSTNFFVWIIVWLCQMPLALFNFICKLKVNDLQIFGGGALFFVLGSYSEILVFLGIFAPSWKILKDISSFEN